MLIINGERCKRALNFIIIIIPKLIIRLSYDQCRSLTDHVLSDFNKINTGRHVILKIETSCDTKNRQCVTTRDGERLKRLTSAL